MWYDVAGKTPRNTQEFVDYRLNQTDKKIDNLTADIKEVNDKLDNQNNVSAAEFTAYKAEVKQEHATKDEVEAQKKRIDNIIKWVSIAASAIIVSVIGLIVQGNLGK